MKVPTARQAFFEVARTEDARYLFTNPGTTELPIFDELVEPDVGLELLLCLHEGVAVAAADGFAQARGRPSLVNLHILPGLANGLSQLSNAAWSRSPVVVTAGQQDTRHVIQEPMLGGDLVGLAEPFARWSYECRRPDEVGIAMRRAFKEAAAGPTFVSIPWDTLDEPGHEIEVPDKTEIARAGAPDEAAVRRAAEALLSAQRPLIVAGDGVARAGAVAELVALAETAGARVAGEPVYGRLNFPHDHPLWLSGMYPTNAFIRNMVSDFDCVVIIGALAFAPLQPSPVAAVPDDTTVIQIDDDAHQIGKTYAAQHALHGDVKATVHALAEHVRALRNETHQDGIERRTRAWSEERAQATAGLAAMLDAQRDLAPTKPMVAVAEILNALPGGTRIVDDAVTSTAFVRTQMRNAEPGSYFFTRGGALGWGLPAAIGVKLAGRERPVVTISGDGTALYAPQALWTMAHHDVPVVSVILNNRSYLILKQGMQAMAGKAAKSGVYPAMDITDPPVDFVALAQSFGVRGERIEKPGDISSAVQTAFASNKPALIEVDVDGAL